jgi:hypothetical protein
VKADGGSGVTGTTIDQWTTHNALLPGGRSSGDMSLTVDYANTLSANYHKIYSGDWESSIAMDRMGLAYGYWGEAAMMAGVYGASDVSMLYPGGGDSGYARDYNDALTASGNNMRQGQYY